MTGKDCPAVSTPDVVRCFTRSEAGIGRVAIPAHHPFRDRNG